MDTGEPKLKTERKISLTKDRVEALPFPSTGYVMYWDSQEKGLGVRVNPTKKTYVIQVRLKGSSKTFKQALGNHPDMNPTDARQKASKLKGQIADGKDPRKTEQAKRLAGETLVAVWDKYKASHTLKPKTISVYSGALKRCFADWLDKPVASINESMVQQRHRDISTTVGDRSNATGAQAQANQAMRILRTLLNYAAREYKDENGKSILPENPVKRLTQEKSWNKNIRRQSVIKKHELKPWMDAVDSLAKDYPDGSRDSTMRDYLILCLFTGLRRSEAAALKWADVDLIADYLVIPADKTKNGEEHRLPLSSYLHELLDKRSKQKSADAVYVFPGEGKTGHIVESKRAIEAIRKRSDVSFMMHDLRRTFITIGEALDIQHYALKRLINHKMSGDVTGGYIVTDVERLRVPMQKITDYILETSERELVQAPPSKTKPSRITGAHHKLEAVG